MGLRCVRGVCIFLVTWTLSECGHWVPPTGGSANTSKLVLLIEQVLLVCVKHVSTEELCIEGMNKCMQNYVDIAHTSKSAEQFCQYYKTFNKCIILACPSLNGTLDVPPEQQEQVQAGFKMLGVDCDAPVGSQGELIGFGAGPGSSPGCNKKTANCTKWYLNATTHVSSRDEVCGLMHTFTACLKEACGVPLKMTQSKLAATMKSFQDLGVQCDVYGMFQMVDEPSNDATSIGINTRLLPLATLLFTLRLFRA